MSNLDENHVTKTSHIPVIDFDDILMSITELQDGMSVIQTAINSIDTSNTSEFSRQLNLLNTSFNNMIVSTTHLESRIALLESKLANFTAPVPPIEIKPSFLSVVLNKFTNTWKSLSN